MDKVTLQSIVNVVIGLGGVIGSLTAISGFFYVSLFRPFRKFLRKEIVGNLKGINETVVRTEERLITHITNPVAHQVGEFHEVNKS
jgi:hypothetical protein